MTLSLMSNPVNRMKGPPANSGSGSVGSITNAVNSRDIIGANGGEPLTISGLVSVVGTPGVTLNGIPANVTGTTSTSITLTTPALSGITGFATVTLVIDGKTFANYDGNQTFPLQTFPNYTLVKGRTGFENGAVLSADGQLNVVNGSQSGSTTTVVTAGTTAPHSGTYCLQQTSGDGNAGSTSPAYGGGWAQADMNLPLGRWHRWFFKMPAATTTALQNNGQIKQFLGRTNTVGSAVIGFGPEAYDPNQEGFGSAPCYNTTGLIDDDAGARLADSFIYTPQNNYGKLSIVTADVWHEIMLWMYFNWNGHPQAGGPVSGAGGTLCYSVMWFDGKKVADSTLPGAIAALPNNLYAMGSGLDADVRGAQFGLVYTQNSINYPLTEYLDDICVANGYIPPNDL